MKNILITLAVMMIGSTAYAWEKRDNPDRFPSFGVSLDGQAVEGEGEIIGAGTGVRDVETKTSQLYFDIRFPATNSLTLSAGLGFVGTEQIVSENRYLYGNESKQNGTRIHLGARFYFNR